MKVVDAIEVYITEKRTHGFGYIAAERHFRRFAKHIGELDLAQVTTKDVSSYLGLPTCASSRWLADYLRLQRFFEYWTIRAQMPALRMPVRPSRGRQTQRFHVYSVNEIRSLLAKTGECQASPNCLFDAETLHTYIVFLYATGMTVCESLDLRRGDVNIKKRSITVYNRKYGWSREVPIGENLRTVLCDFLRRPSVAGYKSNALFADKRGRFIEPWRMTHSFSRLRRLVGLDAADSKVLSPRLLDFRVTFAVHRIRSWIKDGTNLNTMLPALAVYLGQSGLGSIEKYMDLTPERFLGHLAALGPKPEVKAPLQDTKTRMRDPACVHVITHR